MKPTHQLLAKTYQALEDMHISDSDSVKDWERLVRTYLSIKKTLQPKVKPVESEWQVRELEP